MKPETSPAPQPMARSIEHLANRMYTRYCEAVGGKAFNGDPLPTWDEFAADETKQKQVNSWREVAKIPLSL